MAYDVRADISAILAYCNEGDADPAARLALISTLSRYQEQLRHLAQLKDAIDEHGAMMDIRDSYGKAVLIENPAVRTYTKVTKEANATAAKLLSIWKSIKR